jgi:hypothetical protein
VKKTATTTRKSGRVAGHEMGERTVQLFKMPDSLYWSVILRSRNRSVVGKKVNVGDIYDDALTWFFEREARVRYDTYLAVPLRNAQKRSLWIDSRLLERATDVAERDGVPRNRVLYTAMVSFIKEFGPVASAKDIAHLRKLKSQGDQQGRPIGKRNPKKASLSA